MSNEALMPLATQPADRARHNAALWVCVLISPLAWLAQLQLVYMLADQACKGNASLWQLHLVTLVCVLAALFGAGLSLQQWRQRKQDGQSDALRVRRVWMAQQGMLTSGLFCIAIIAQWLAVVYLNPCPL
jgi:hypothetical protein